MGLETTCCYSSFNSAKSRLLIMDEPDPHSITKPNDPFRLICGSFRTDSFIYYPSS